MTSAPPASGYVPKAGAPTFFYFVSEDIETAFDWAVNAKVGIATWLTLEFLGIPLGPQATADF